MMKFVYSLLAVAALLYAGACLYLYFNQRTLLYYPTASVQVPHASHLTLQSGQQKLKIWRVGNGDEAIVYFGGNAEDVAQNIPQFATGFAEHTVYLVNYRGYGGSSGTPSEAGLFEDALTVHDFVQARHTRLTVIGRSLGSGVAIFLASARPVDRLALITPYDSIENLARLNFPAFPVSWLLQDKYASISRAPAIKIPTLVMLAQHDEIIPRTSSEALIAALTQAQLDVNVIPATTHNSIGADPTYWKRLQEFIQYP